MVLSKKTQYVQITPIPSFIPRELAIDFLHSHGEILELNPLVTSYEAIKAPRDAPADEFYATWYEISQRIQYVPGLGKLGSGAIKFRDVFHDLPFGLQTHTYAPANVDLRNKWQICGNQPGEPPEPKELGSAAPPEGLYIREDVEIKCNVTMLSFVKKEMKAAAKVMMDRLVKKAELLDAGALQAMMENGRLKTVNPADRSMGGDYKSPQPSPAMLNQVPMSPSRSSTISRTSPYQQPVSPYGQPTSPDPRVSVLQSPGLQSASLQPSDPRVSVLQSPSFQPPGLQPSDYRVSVLQQNYVPPEQLIGQNSIVMELPGDFSYSQPQTSPGLQQANNNNSRYRDPAISQGSPQFGDNRWSQASHLSGTSSQYSAAGSDGMRSPPVDQKMSFAAELPTMEETREEHDERIKRESQIPADVPPIAPLNPHPQRQTYNPQDYKPKSDLSLLPSAQRQTYNPGDYAKPPGIQSNGQEYDASNRI